MRSVKTVPCRTQEWDFCYTPYSVSQGSFDCHCYNGFSGVGLTNCTSNAMVSHIMFPNNHLILTLVAICFSFYF